MSKYEEEMKRIAEQIQDVANRMAQDTKASMVRVSFDCIWIGGVATTHMQAGGMGPPQQSSAEVANEMLDMTLKSRKKEDS